MRSEDDWCRLDDDSLELDGDYPDIFGDQSDDGRVGPLPSVEPFV